MEERREVYRGRAVRCGTSRGGAGQIMKGLDGAGCVGAWRTPMA